MQGSAAARVSRRPPCRWRYQTARARSRPMPAACNWPADFGCFSEILNFEFGIQNSLHAVVTNQHRGDVVALRLAGAESVDVGEQGVEHLLRRRAAMGVGAGDQAIVGE